MLEKLALSKNKKLLTGLFVSSFFISVTVASAVEQPLNAASAVPAIVGTTATSSVNNWHARNGMRIQRNWGVDVVGVRPVSTGFMLAFRYKIVDVEKAKLLNDKRSKAYLIDEATGNALGVPIMEKLGEMRQKAPPELGRTYFIMFGNPGKLVKSGSRVSVVVGDFRIDNLVVD
jgi:hypothetical protein